MTNVLYKSNHKLDCNSFSPGNQPGRGLSLTAKAIARKKEKPQKKSSEKDTSKEV